ncbi:geranylgeranylglycerol-phosphate geranylgeranyltransferase [Polaribacter batillariae]|uniref:Geranylgeranylglycerol-phosphate geranylgeranyltransferase n=1 Tax=Polaribacter batillariae TaxID=2808900 RepID=A0ABX7SWG8_9FLAO|nr:geranylgeranylglycerol-phosphate geranylgeranyltransferase [Polaribacter batillariae]QTD37836.1 geranylgeranylglycerol-phosphate geranylgeranyltransferase [Polaribacter batillariae]
MVLLTMVLTKYALIKSFFRDSYLSDFEFIILALSVILITAGGYIINDIFDVKADKINKPNKVFIGVRISKKNAWRSYFLITFLGLALGIYLSIISLNYQYSFIFFSCSIFLLIYASILKKIVFVGNFIVSILIILSILIVYFFDVSSANEFNKNKILLLFKILSSYVAFAFITTLIREIIKDIEDINGDLKIKAKTLPILLGRKRAAKVAFFCSCVLLVLLLIVLQFAKSKILFLAYGVIFILLPLLFFMYLLWKAEKKKDFTELSNIMKGIMFFGILSMLLFAIN